MIDPVSYHVDSNVSGYFTEITYFGNIRFDVANDALNDGDGVACYDDVVDP